MALFTASPVSRYLIGRLLLLLVLAGDVGAVAVPYANQRLPGSLELFESGLYWLQDLTGPGEPGDPAAMLGLMQEAAARQFDFGELSRRVGGARYVRLDILARSHFQHRVRDRLFAELAQQLGLYDSLMPRFRLLSPVRTAPERAVVGVWVIRRHNVPRRLDFHLYLGSRGWRVVDVSSDGHLFSDYLHRQE